jgi:hypothetical protein
MRLNNCPDPDANIGPAERNVIGAIGVAGEIAISGEAASTCDISAGSTFTAEATNKQCSLQLSSAGFPWPGQHG